MIRAAALAFAVLVPAPFASAQTATQKSIKGDWITLGDVTPVTGDVAGILIGPAPPPGQTLSLDPAFLIATAKGAGVILAIPLDKPILVTRAGGTATQAPRANAAKPANVAPQLASEASTPSQMLVLVRDVTRGQRIVAADLGWEDASPSRPIRNSATDTAAVIGMESRRVLKTGQPILLIDLKTPAVIHKGDAVKIVYTAPGLHLSVDGVAQNEAARGENVRILNNYTKRTIEAVATSEGEARISSR